MQPYTAVLASLIAVVMTVSPTVVAADEAPWHEQLMEMGWHILHLSSINVINGLELSREQVRELRAMAREVEQAGGYVPTMKDDLPGDLAEMRKTYVDLAEVLLAGAEVSGEMTRRVMRARAVEARVIRESVSERPTPRDRGTCARCHLSSARVARLREAKGTTGDALKGRGVYETPAAKRETALAHIEGVLGAAGMLKVRRLAARVDQLLNKGQKLALGEFSCCLIPPKDLSDPVRIGQAPASDRKLELLETVRRVPEARWEHVREAIVTRLAVTHTFRRTGASEKDLAEYARRVRAVLEKARSLSDVDFELDKEALCAELSGAAPPPPETPNQRLFKQAYFLLMPGSVKAYDALLERMDKERQ